MNKIEQVESMFNCDQCSTSFVDMNAKTFIVPVTLPCGSTVCISHIKNRQKRFKCTLCKDIHSTPKSGFKPNKHLQKALEQYQVFNAYPVVDECRKRIKGNATKLDELESLANKPEVFINEYFEEIKNQVVQRREQLKKDIDESSIEALLQVERAKNSCLKNSPIARNALIELVAAKEELKKLKDTFNTLEINEDKFNNTKTKLVALEHKLDKKMTKNKRSMLENREYSFVASEAKIASVFGKLVDFHVSVPGKFFFHFFCSTERT